jgi:hypothetical protein
MRAIILVLGLVTITACNDEIQKKEALPTAPRKAAVVASPVAALRFDTTKASSICKASVRAGAKARARLDEAPSDAFARSKVTTFAALVADACK